MEAENNDEVPNGGNHEASQNSAFMGEEIHWANVPLTSSHLWVDKLCAINHDDSVHTVQLNLVNLTHMWWFRLLFIGCMMIRENSNQFMETNVISIICTMSHFRILIFFFSFSAFSGMGNQNQNHYFLSILAPFSTQLILCTTAEQSPEFPQDLPTIITQGKSFLK